MDNITHLWNQKKVKEFIQSSHTLRRIGWNLGVDVLSSGMIDQMDYGNIQKIPSLISFLDVWVLKAGVYGKIDFLKVKKIRIQG